MPLPPNPLTLERRVEFSQTDAAGLIHFSTYFIYMEAAEARLFRALEIPLLWQDGDLTCGFPRVDCQCRFRRPLGFDDPVRIEMEIDAIMGNRIHYRFHFRGPNGKKCAEGQMVTACAARGPDGQLTAATIPEIAREKLEAWKNQAS